MANVAEANMLFDIVQLSFLVLGEDMPRKFCDSWKAWEIATLFLPKSLRPFQLLRALGHWGLAQHRALRDPTAGVPFCVTFLTIPNDFFYNPRTTLW